MRYTHLLKSLPPSLRIDVQVLLEEAALGSHFTREELQVAVGDIFHRAACSPAEAKLLTSSLRDEIVDSYF